MPNSKVLIIFTDISKNSGSIPNIIPTYNRYLTEVEKYSYMSLNAEALKVFINWNLMTTDNYHITAEGQKILAELINSALSGQAFEYNISGFESYTETSNLTWKITNGIKELLIPPKTITAITNPIILKENISAPFINTTFSARACTFTITSQGTDQLVTSVFNFNNGNLSVPIPVGMSNVTKAVFNTNTLLYSLLSA